MIEQTKSLYDELGTDVGIRKIVDDFYVRIVADPKLERYFSTVDMPTLRRHQVEMLSAATGGPKQYAGREMAAAHAGLAITHDHFDNVVQHLVASLGAFGVSPDAISRILGALSPLRSEIVTS